MPEADRDYPRLFPKPDQTIVGIGWAIREGRVTCVDVLDRCLEQVDDWEPKVHAWVVLDREGSLEQARALDYELKTGKDRGPLHGIPIGIKDLFDVQGLPTACGAKRWVDRIADIDAEAVWRLRKAGAVIMGKTVTTAYACLDPPITRNPWDLERTPGGSSSGSAAAVACGMCFGALGTQTGGSITRPASFCGVAGMKPSKVEVFDLSDGLLPFAPSLDHVGPIARTVDDLRLLFLAVSERRRRRTDEAAAREAREFSARILRFPGSFAHESRTGEQEDRIPRETALRLVRFRGFFDRRAEASVRSVFEDALRVLAAHGVEIIEQDDPVDFDQVLKNHGRVIAAEAAGVHSDWLDEFPDDYPSRIRELILEGRSASALEYLKAKDGMMDAGRMITRAIGQEDSEILITPATVGTAPARSTTGDPALNAPWSYTHLPTVSFPIGIASDGLPVAVQLVGRMMGDPELLSEAASCEQIVRS
jgi:Asp-tRNA(Asn)/Glu-tRNA(Gln) amidotransferase A subunit family amidase